MPYYRELRERRVPVIGPVAASFLPVGERSEELRIWQLADGDVIRVGHSEIIVRVH